MTGVANTPPPGPSVIRPATRADTAAASRALAAAFIDDPYVCWLIPDAQSRPARAERMFATLLSHHLRVGRVEVAADASGLVHGATLWAPPQRWRHTLFDQARMTPGMLGAFGGRLALVARADHQLARAHPREPHWYLQTIGTAPQARGRRFGQALLRSQLDRCDREGQAAYLESSKPENVPFYERFGFTTTEVITMVSGGPPITLMWRPAR